jgi:hypothetical protein
MPFNSLIIFSNAFMESEISGAIVFSAKSNAIAGAACNKRTIKISQQKNKRKALKVVRIHSKEYLLKMAQCKTCFVFNLCCN